MLLVEKCAHGSDRGGRLLLHEPMPRASNDHFLHVHRGGAHDNGHGRSEGLLAAHRQHWHGQLAFGQEDEIVDRVLIEGGELAEAGVHRTRLRIQLCVVFARGLAERLRVRGKLVPEAVKIDAFASGDQPLHIRAAEAEMPRSGLFSISSHGPIPGSGASIKANRVTRSGHWAANAYPTMLPMSCVTRSARSIPRASRTPATSW